MSPFSRLISACTASAIVLFTLTGCGVSPSLSSGPVQNYVAAPMHGVVMGGPNPVSNETVSVYVTSSNGYGVSTQNGGNAWQQRTTTGTAGTFNFTGGYNCPAGQYVYIVAAGGNTGGNSVNSQAVLVAALGRCDDLFAGGGGSSVGAFTGGAVNINELTTVAAAYALGSFSSVTGTGASTVVQIGAPATNNAPEISGVSTGCVAGVGSCGGTTVAAGLYHAFLNAANLVSSFATGPIQSANSAPTSNAGGVVPQQLINSIGNSLVACINSNGGSIGDGSACGMLLDLTTLPAARVPSWTTATPNNTFSAMVNLAANPTLSGVTLSGTDCNSGATAAIACFYGIATPATNVYSPALTTAVGLSDYSIGIYYPAGMGSSVSQFQTVTVTGVGSGYSSAPAVGFTGGCTVEPVAAATMAGTAPNQTVSAVTISAQGTGCTSAPAVTFTGGTPTTVATAAAFVNTTVGNGQGLLFPTSGALDINDVFYLTNMAGATGATPINLFAFSSNGALLGTTANPASGSATHAYGLSVDGVGNGYFGNGSTSGSTALAVFKTGAGTGLAQYTTPLQTALSGIHVFSTAVDRQNNLWVFGDNTTAGATTALAMCAAGAGGAAATLPCTGEGTFIFTASPTGNTSGISIDPNQNVWVAANTTVAVLPNTGTVGTPAYAGAQLTTSSGTGTLSGGIAFTPGTGGLPSAFVSSSQPGTTGLLPFTPTYTTPTITALGQGTITTASNVITGTEFSAEGDGAGNVWLADTNSRSVIQFVPNLTPANATAIRYQPCNGMGGTTCGSAFIIGKPFTISIDSTGSIWTTDQAVGSLVQIIGAAAPTWPLLSLGKTGKP